MVVPIWGKQRETSVKDRRLEGGKDEEDWNPIFNSHEKSGRNIGYKKEKEKEKGIGISEDKKWTNVEPQEVGLR